MRMGDTAHRMWHEYGLYWPALLTALILAVCLYDGLFR